MNISRALIAVLLMGSAAIVHAQITSADNSVHPGSHPSVKIALSTSATQFKLGEPVRLDILLTNISGHPIFVGKEIGINGANEYDVFVVNDHGKSAPTTAYYRFIKGRRRPGDPKFFYSSHSRAILLVSPDQSVKSQIDLGKVYKIDQPGIYKIWVERQDEISNQKLKSNTMTITMTP